MVLHSSYFLPIQVTEEGGQWTIKTSTMLKSMELKFKLGEEFDEKTPDGREVTSIVTREGNKLICKQTAKNEGEASTISTRCGRYQVLK